MDNLRVVVTGSTSGIGLGIARAFAATGANIVVSGFGDANAIEALRGDLERDFNVRVHHHAADLAIPEQCTALVRDSEQWLGGIDVLVNNAGVQHTDPIERFPPERWDAIMAINLSAAFHTIRAALPGMRARGWGRVINIASVHGLVASVNKCAYVAAKHGLIGLTKVVALETAVSGITCNAICPGWVRTPLVERQIEARASATGAGVEAAAQELLTEKQPTQRFTAIADVAATAVFLAGESAGNITGASLTLDGGWIAQ